MNLKWILTLAFILSTQSAFAKPIIDSSLQDLLKHPSVNSEHEIEVLLLYPMDAGSRAQSLAVDQEPGQLIKRWQKDVRKMEEKVFREMAFIRRPMTDSLWLIHGTKVTCTINQLKSLAESSHIVAIRDLKRPVFLVKNHGPHVSAPLANVYTYGLHKIGVSQIRSQRPELLGQNVRVGIIDSGIDPTHVSLRGKIEKFYDFIGTKKETPYDDNGHGTHVAGTVAGRETSGKEIGVAPESELYIAKAFNSGGSSGESQLLKAMQWVADPDGDPATNDQVQVVNNSWSMAGDFSKSEPDEEAFCRATQGWLALGIIPIFAAGNSGPYASTIGLPAACPTAVAVGATDSQDNIARFSSRGPIYWRVTRQIKPDVSAPGVDIESARNGGGLRLLSGTSMASPHVTGAMALLLQAFPESSTDQLIQRLIESAKDLGETGLDSKFGAGRIDLVRALEP